MLFLLACSNPPAAPPVAVADTGWVTGIKGWYCGEELRTELDKPRVFNVALKLVPNKDRTGFTGTYAKVEARDHEVGGLTHFKAGGGARSGVLKYADNRKKKGEATLTFSSDYTSVTVTWSGEGLTDTLAASEMSRCVAGPLIK